MEKRTYGGRVELQCERCGHQFTRPKSRVQDHAFCSRACYFASGIPTANAIKANRTKHPDGGILSVKCLNCGTEFPRFKSQAVAKRTYCSVACKKSHAIALGTPQLTSSGYIRIYVGSEYGGASAAGHIAEHRKVMQDALGRTLLPHENVHHINGVRTDNRLENLELWSSSQPSGQRVEDKIRWAREFLAQYEGGLIMPT